jgi:hypothetical protein
MSEIENVFFALLRLYLDVTFQDSFISWKLDLLLSSVKSVGVLVNVGLTEIPFTGTGPLQFFAC